MSNDFSKAIGVLDKYQQDFRQEAKLADEENRFPTSNFAIIKEHNLLAIIIPNSHGGFGLNFQQYQHFIARLAQFSSSTASALNMHCIILGALADIPMNSPVLLASKESLLSIESIFHEVVSLKKVFASATTEPEIGARYSKTKTNYELIGDQYLINGTKSFVTMADYADYYSIIANRKPNNLGEEISSKYLTFFIVPRETEGVIVEQNWDTLGFRATQSHTVHFKNVLLSKQQVFLGMTGLALNKIINQPHWVVAGYAGVYLGIMKAALNDTVNYIKQRTNHETASGLGYQPLIQSKLAKMYILYQNTFNAIEQASQLVLKEPNSLDTHRAIYLAKHQAGENVAELTALAIKTCGGSSIHKRFDFERYYRDGRCGALMPAVSDACELYLARNLLSLPLNTIW